MGTDLVPPMDTNPPLFQRAESAELSVTVENPQNTGNPGTDTDIAVSRGLSVSDSKPAARDLLAAEFRVDRAFVDYVWDNPIAAMGAAEGAEDLARVYVIASAKYDPLENLQAAKSIREESASEFESMVRAAMLREKVRQEAQRRILSEGYQGSEELTWGDLADQGVDYLVEDLVPSGSLVFLYARPNLGKTFCYIDMVGRMACGLPWLGKSTRQAQTLIVLGEGRNGFLPRLQAWAGANARDTSELKPWIRFVDGANLSADTSLDRLKRIAADQQTELIIFDTWATVQGSDSEDDAAVNSETLRRAQSIRPEATLLFVHHPRKGEENTERPIMRGSSALAGRAEVVISMWRDKNFVPKSAQAGTHEWLALSTDPDHGGKNRTASQETIRGLYLDSFGPSAVMRQERSEAISPSSRRIEEILKAAPATAKGLASILECSERTAKRYLDKAVREGVAEHDGKLDGAQRYKIATSASVAWAAIA